MANQIVVTQSGNVQVSIEPTPNVQVQISRAAITTLTDVPTANFANFAGNVTGANQPNITNIGTLSNLTVSNTATIGNLVVTGNLSVGNLVANNANYANYAGEAFNVAVANVNGLGNIAVLNLDGNSGNILYGNGIFSAVPNTAYANNANYANFAGEAFNVSGSNVTGTVANATYADNAGNATIANSANAVAGANVSGEVAFAAVANSVAGANVSGTVANATYADNAGNATVASSANSVAVANVVGIGNIATTNYDGNIANILHGDGSWGPEIGPQSVANANYANFAGTAYSVAGSNVSGEVAYAAVANSVAGANVSGEVAYAAVANSVAVANVSGIGNIATINLDGSSSNVLYGNGAFATISIPPGDQISNGTSNVSIPVANGSIAFSANNVANVVLIENGGLVNAYPTSSTVNMLRINTFGNPLSDAHRVAWARARGSNTSPTSVNPSDNLGVLAFFGHNGTSYQTNSVGFVRARVDASYTTNGANIPIGMQVLVNDTNGGINNQTKTHNFYSNGNVTFAQYVNATGFIGDGGNLTNLPVANITGLGNIATINLDGNSSNALLGDGSFGPVEVTSTSISNGTSNLSIPTSNGSLAWTGNGNANVVTMDGNGTIVITPKQGGYNNILTLYNYGTSGNVNAGRIASFRYRGNSTANLSVEPNDGLMDLIALGFNGTSLATGGSGRIKALVDSSYVTNGANIPIGWQIQVNDTNGGVNNQSKTHNFYSNGNVVFANSLVVTDNVTSTSGTFFGNGAGLTNIPAGNLSGNLTYLNVVDSANVTGTIQQLAPNTITITTSSVNNTAYDLTTIYGETSNIQESGQRAIIRSRGNVSTPATTVVGDIGNRDRVYFYNGTTNALGFATSVVLSNLNSNSNAYSTGAIYNISTGNPDGDQGNANAASGTNLLQFAANGRLTLLPGSNSSSASLMGITSYGTTSSPSTAQGLTFSKARGNRDANLSVEPNDQLGRFVFQGHNGTSFVTNRLPILRATVDSTYVPNTANIPAGFQMLVCDNTSYYTHNFYANGVTTFGGNLSSANVTGNVSAGNLYTSGDINITGTMYSGNVNTGDIFSGNINAFGSGITAGNTFNLTLDNNATQAILQSTYNNANIQTGTWTSWRHRGNVSNPLPAQAGDEVSKFSSVIRADSTNTYFGVSDFATTVQSNDGLGNVDAIMRARVYGANSTYAIMAAETTFASENDFGANATIYANGYIQTNNSIDYNRVFGCFHKIANVTAAAANTIYEFNWYTDTTAHVGNQGVTVTSGNPTRVNIDTAGNYNVFMEMQAQNTDNTDRTAWIWLAKNGTDIDETRITVTLLKEWKQVISKAWLLDSLAANDYIELRFAVDNTSGISLNYSAAQTSPFVMPAQPSATITVTPVGA